MTIKQEKNNYKNGKQSEVTRIYDKNNNIFVTFYGNLNRREIIRLTNIWLINK